MKGVILFGKNGKLKPRYSVPYVILRRVYSVVYELEFPSSLRSIHSVFHIYMRNE